MAAEVQLGSVRTGRITDARGRRVTQRDPVAMHILHRHNVIVRLWFGSLKARRAQPSHPPASSWVSLRRSSILSRDHSHPFDTRSRGPAGRLPGTSVLSARPTSDRRPGPPHGELLQQSATYPQLVFVQFQSQAGDSRGDELVSPPESDVLLDADRQTSTRARLENGVGCPLLVTSDSAHHSQAHFFHFSCCHRGRGWYLVLPRYGLGRRGKERVTK